jgi:hypothetical protein
MPGDFRSISSMLMPGMARRGVPVGTDQREHPVGEVAIGRPHLVAIDDEMITIGLGARFQAHEVGTGARF